MASRESCQHDKFHIIYAVLRILVRNQVMSDFDFKLPTMADTRARRGILRCERRTTRSEEDDYLLPLRCIWRRNTSNFLKPPKKSSKIRIPPNTTERYILLVNIRLYKFPGFRLLVLLPANLCFKNPIRILHSSPDPDKDRPLLPPVLHSVPTSRIFHNRTEGSKEVMSPSIHGEHLTCNSP